ncbi:MAG: hypothetical protein PHD56_10155 [Anaerostipes sp.]|nr:hypothetical protein [Anaerostipes sp.]
MALCILVFVGVAFFGYRTYVVYQAYLDAKDTIIIHEDSKIKELP